MGSGDLVTLSGDLGAGKTTFGDEYLSTEERDFAFVNADEIARDLDAEGFRARSDVLAARMMLKRVDALVQANADFVVETTLAALTYARKIPGWRAKGYVVSLVYLRLGSVEESIMRVRRRVAAGGLKYIRVVRLRRARAAHRKFQHRAGRSRQRKTFVRQEGRFLRFFIVHREPLEREHGADGGADQLSLVAQRTQIFNTGFRLLLGQSFADVRNLLGNTGTELRLEQRGVHFVERSAGEVEVSAAPVVLGKVGATGGVAGVVVVLVSVVATIML